MKSIIVPTIFLLSLLLMVSFSVGLSYAAAPIFSCTGYVVNQSGAGLGGIPVTLHIMCIDNNGTPCELYNMTIKTNNNPPFIGDFQFDSIVFSQGVNVTYGYVDAVFKSADNRTTYYGKSNNFSMSQPGTTVAEIVIYIYIPITSPTATTPTSYPTMLPDFTPPPTPSPFLPTTPAIFPSMPRDNTPSPTPSPFMNGLFTLLVICVVALAYMKKGR